MNGMYRKIYDLQMAGSEAFAAEDPQEEERREADEQ
jgi:hypothetical protein